ncbi:MAG: hypothetical protein WCK49_02625 [Myxococcaceae bacterium]
MRILLLCFYMSICFLMSCTDTVREPNNQIPRGETAFRCTSKQSHGDYHHLAPDLVTDRNTNLVWSYPDSSLYTAADAGSKCANGFRLPSKTELLSLKDYADYLFSEHLSTIQGKEAFETLDTRQFCYYYSLNGSHESLGRICEYNGQCGTHHIARSSTSELDIYLNPRILARFVCLKAL